MDFSRVCNVQRLLADSISTLLAAPRRLCLYSSTSRPFRRRYATDINPTEAAFERSLREQAGLPQTPDQKSTPSNSKTLEAQRAQAESQALVDSYFTNQHIKQTTARLGSELDLHYEPQSLINNPPSVQDVSLELLMASQSHMGHSTSLWHPANSRYIFGVREGIHIISLDATAAHLRRAAKVVQSVAEYGGVILFAGTRPGQDRCVVRAAGLAGACHLFEKWVPGTITNGIQILGGCDMMVVDEFDKPVPGFEEQLRERGPLQPDLVVCLNTLENYIMLHECGMANIPTIGIVDTDTNPTWVTYPIPANDDSLRSVAVIAGVLGRAGAVGRERRLELAKQGHVTYPPPTNLKLPNKPRTGEDEQPSPRQRRGARRDEAQEPEGNEEDVLKEGSPTPDAFNQLQNERFSDDASNLATSVDDTARTRALQEEEEEQIYDEPASQETKDENISDAQRNMKKEDDEMEQGRSQI